MTFTIAGRSTRPFQPVAGAQHLGDDRVVAVVAVGSCITASCSFGSNGSPCGSIALEALPSRARRAAPTQIGLDLVGAVGERAPSQASSTGSSSSTSRPVRPVDLVVGLLRSMRLR